MLTSVARSALRRVLTRAPAATVSSAARAFPIRSALQIRSFTSSKPVCEAVAATSAGAKKSTVAKKRPAKKAATKKKVAAKKKAAPKKKKAPVKPKKKLTAEEKEADKIKLLKKMALLNEPKNLPVNTWLLYVSRNQKQQPTSETQKAIASAYHSLSATEMADLRAATDANKSTNHNQHLQWVESHNPETILLANISRRELARKTGKKISPIKDARLPHSIRSAFNFYMIDRLAGRGSVAERFSEVASTWKTLSSEDKRPFNEMAEAEKTLMTRQREELMVKVKDLRNSIKEEAKTKSRSVSRKTKAAATNELGL
ncbi:hypothetical protein NLU13_9255 [Sarocladium strictum]|uniref:HMG box domain-containing protein n=1 Tax=Sarocladium strictum TaxID=5046 RepID=A0AA39L408_SARSR|nr:hypothetical protein NLU13_9255 [Sarocladium strictum]